MAPGSASGARPPVRSYGRPCYRTVPDGTMTSTARTAPARRRRGSVLRATIWLLAVLLPAEGAVRGAALLLRRGQSFAGPHSGANVIYCIGDSFTYGQGVEEEQAWPQ